MTSCPVEVLGLSKKFSRTPASGLRNSLLNLGQRILSREPSAALRPSEFWALRDINLSLARGECLGVIGPNGAGKSTLLRLISGELRADFGSVRRRSAATVLSRLGQGLQPLLSGRENLFARFQAQGVSMTATEALVDAVRDFSGLKEAFDQPVRQYSDGMCARLEFAMATAIPPDLLLIDEVLAVGDFAFQMRCLERLESLKREGTAILFVSHSEMTVRHVADRCLLLYEGECLGIGDPDGLFRQYYQAAGFLDRHLKVLAPIEDCPQDFGETPEWSVSRESKDSRFTAVCTGPLTLYGRVAGRMPPADELLLQFFTPSDLLLASLKVALPEEGFAGNAIEIGTLGLPPGLYRMGGGVMRQGRWVGYRRQWGELSVRADPETSGQGLFRLKGELVSG